MQIVTKDRFSKMVFIFLFFSIIGWGYEVTLAFLYGYGFVNRGFLSGPYLPLYGFGALILIGGLHWLMARPVRIGKVSITPVLVFIGIMVITTVVEYCTGILLETFAGQRFWDYSTYPYNFQGRICLSASIRFGLGGMLFLYILTPLFSRLLAKIPSKGRRIAAAAVVCLLVVDLILTLYLASVYGFNPTLAQPR